MNTSETLVILMMVKPQIPILAPYYWERNAINFWDLSSIFVVKCQFIWEVKEPPLIMLPSCLLGPGGIGHDKICCKTLKKKPDHLTHQ